MPLLLLLVHFVICHSKKCLRPRTSSCHFCCQHIMKCNSTRVLANATHQHTTEDPSVLHSCPADSPPLPSPFTKPSGQNSSGTGSSSSSSSSGSAETKAVAPADAAPKPEGKAKPQVQTPAAVQGQNFFAAAARSQPPAAAGAATAAAEAVPKSPTLPLATVAGVSQAAAGAAAVSQAAAAVAAAAVAAPEDLIEPPPPMTVSGPGRDGVYWRAGG